MTMQLVLLKVRRTSYKFVVIRPLDIKSLPYAIFIKKLCKEL